MQYVCHNGVQSDKRLTSHGVPQGSIVGTTFFLIYTNDLFMWLPSESIVAYTDDITLLANSDSANMAMDALQHLIDIVSGWFAINCRSLNTAKCLTMSVAPSKKKAATSYPHCSPNIKSSPIPWVHLVKILCVFFNYDLDWRQHAKSVRTTMSRKLAVLHRIRSLLST